MKQLLILTFAILGLGFSIITPDNLNSGLVKGTTRFISGIGLKFKFEESFIQ